MTKPVISDTEAETFASRLMYLNEAPFPSSIKDALSAFLAARVPPQSGTPRVHRTHLEDDFFDNGFNACREQVLQGKT